MQPPASRAAPVHAWRLQTLKASSHLWADSADRPATGFPQSLSAGPGVKYWCRSWTARTDGQPAGAAARIRRPESEPAPHRTPAPASWPPGAGRGRVGPSQSSPSRQSNARKSISNAPGVPAATPLHRDAQSQCSRPAVRKHSSITHPPPRRPARRASTRAAGAGRRSCASPAPESGQHNPPHPPPAG